MMAKVLTIADSIKYAWYAAITKMRSIQTKLEDVLMLNGGFLKLAKNWHDHKLNPNCIRIVAKYTIMITIRSEVFPLGMK